MSRPIVSKPHIDMLSTRHRFRQHTSLFSDSNEERNDFGFGSKVAEETAVRLVNRDGSFNVNRWGLPFLQSLSMYHALLTMSWSRFIVMSFVAFSAVNSIFAGLIVLAGPQALIGRQAANLAGYYLESFFFSAQTFTTVGYGTLAPGNLAASVIATVAAFFGLLAFALAAGLVFARFSRPIAKIRFSDYAVIAPYHDKTGFEFRIANVRRGHLIDVEAKVGLRLVKNVAGQRVQRFYTLDLERDKVEYFPLSWTIVHPIDDQSPLANYDQKALEDAHAEFIIQLTGIDELSSQVVHTRSSYGFDEVRVGYRFANIIEPTRDGTVHIDLHRLDEIEPV